MRDVNLSNFYMLKMVEVIFLAGCTGAILVSMINILNYPCEFSGEGSKNTTFALGAPEG